MENLRRPEPEEGCRTERAGLLSGPMTGGRAAFIDMLVGLRGQIRSISGRFTGTGIGGTCPLAEQAESLRPGWLRILVVLLFREEAREVRELEAASGMELLLPMLMGLTWPAEFWRLLRLVLLLCWDEDMAVCTGG